MLARYAESFPLLRCLTIYTIKLEVMKLESVCSTFRPADLLPLFNYTGQNRGVFRTQSNI